jgi:hypothetical protein
MSRGCKVLPPRVSARVSPRRVLRALLLTIAVLVSLHGVMVVAIYEFGNPGFLKLQTFFDLNKEENVPALFSALQLLFASLLLWVVFAYSRHSNDRDRYYWAGLAVVFVLLAGDEFSGWHEQMITPLQQAFHTTGALTFAWVVPYSLFILLFVAGYFRFWRRLPPRTRWRFGVAGALYVTGGIVLEMVGSKIFTVYGWESVPFKVEVMVEEGLEMIGVALFVHAILCYLGERAGTLEIDIADPPTSPASS